MISFDAAHAAVHYPPDRRHRIWVRPSLLVAAALIVLLPSSRRSWPQGCGRRALPFGYRCTHGSVPGEPSACRSDDSHRFAGHYLSARFQLTAQALVINRLAGLPYPLWRNRRPAATAS